MAYQPPSLRVMQKQLERLQAKGYVDAKLDLVSPASGWIDEALQITDPKKNTNSSFYSIYNPDNLSEDLQPLPKKLLASIESRFKNVDYLDSDQMVRKFGSPVFGASGNSNIYINKDAAKGQKLFRTLTHELGHYELRHGDLSKPLEIQELEAEMVAYGVAKKLGLDKNPNYKGIALDPLQGVLDYRKGFTQSQLEANSKASRTPSLEPLLKQVIDAIPDSPNSRHSYFDPMPWRSHLDFVANKIAFGDYEFKDYRLSRGVRSKPIPFYTSQDLPRIKEYLAANAPFAAEVFGYNKNPKYQYAWEDPNFNPERDFADWDRAKSINQNFYDGDIQKAEIEALEFFNRMAKEPDRYRAVQDIPPSRLELTQVSQPASKPMANKKIADGSISTSVKESRPKLTSDIIADYLKMMGGEPALIKPDGSQYNPNRKGRVNIGDRMTTAEKFGQANDIGLNNDFTKLPEVHARFDDRQVALQVQKEIATGRLTTQKFYETPDKAIADQAAEEIRRSDGLLGRGETVEVRKLGKAYEVVAVKQYQPIPSRGNSAVRSYGLGNDPEGRFVAFNKPEEAYSAPKSLKELQREARQLEASGTQALAPDTRPEFKPQVQAQSNWEKLELPARSPMTEQLMQQALPEPSKAIASNTARDTGGWANAVGEPFSPPRKAPPVDAVDIKQPNFSAEMGLDTNPTGITDRGYYNKVAATYANDNFGLGDRLKPFPDFYELKRQAKAEGVRDEAFQNYIKGRANAPLVEAGIMKAPELPMTARLGQEYISPKTGKVGVVESVGKKGVKLNVDGQAVPVEYKTLEKLKYTGNKGFGFATPAALRPVFGGFVGGTAGSMAFKQLAQAVGLNEDQQNAAAATGGLIGSFAGSAATNLPLNTKLRVPTAKEFATTMMGAPQSRSAGARLFDLASSQSGAFSPAAIAPDVRAKIKSLPVGEIGNGIRFYDDLGSTTGINQVLREQATNMDLHAGLRLSLDVDKELSFKQSRLDELSKTVNAAEAIGDMEVFGRHAYEIDSLVNDIEALKSTKEAQVFARSLQDDLEIVPTKPQITYRGMVESAADFRSGYKSSGGSGERLAESIGLRPDRTFYDKAFMATTPNRNYADRYGKDITLEVMGSAGYRMPTRHADMGGEVLYPAGNQFDVENYRVDGEKVTARLVDRNLAPDEVVSLKQGLLRRSPISKVDSESSKAVSRFFKQFTNVADARDAQNFYRQLQGVDSSDYFSFRQGVQRIDSAFSQRFPKSRYGSRLMSIDSLSGYEGVIGLSDRLQARRSLDYTGKFQESAIANPNQFEYGQKFQSPRTGNVGSLVSVDGQNITLQNIDGAQKTFPASTLKNELQIKSPATLTDLKRGDGLISNKSDLRYTVMGVEGDNVKLRGEDGAIKTTTKAKVPQLFRANTLGFTAPAAMRPIIGGFVGGTAGSALFKQLAKSAGLTEEQQNQAAATGGIIGSFGGSALTNASANTKLRVPTAKEFAQTMVSTPQQRGAGARLFDLATDESAIFSKADRANILNNRLPQYDIKPVLSEAAVIAVDMATPSPYGVATVPALRTATELWQQNFDDVTEKGIAGLVNRRNVDQTIAKTKSLKDLTYQSLTAIAKGVGLPFPMTEQIVGDVVDRVPSGQQLMDMAKRFGFGTFDTRSGVIASANPERIVSMKPERTSDLRQKLLDFNQRYESGQIPKQSSSGRFAPIPNLSVEQTAADMGMTLKQYREFQSGAERAFASKQKPVSSGKPPRIVRADDVVIDQQTGQRINMKQYRKASKEWRKLRDTETAPLRQAYDDAVRSGDKELQSAITEAINETEARLPKAPARADFAMAKPESPKKSSGGFGKTQPKQSTFIPEAEVQKAAASMGASTAQVKAQIANQRSAGEAPDLAKATEAIAPKMSEPTVKTILPETGFDVDARRQATFALSNRAFKDNISQPRLLKQMQQSARSPQQFTFDPPLPQSQSVARAKTPVWDLPAADFVPLQIPNKVDPRLATAQRVGKRIGLVADRIGASGLGTLMDTGFAALALTDAASRGENTPTALTRAGVSVGAGYATTALASFIPNPVARTAAQIGLGIAAVTGADKAIDQVVGRDSAREEKFAKDLSKLDLQPTNESEQWKPFADNNLLGAYGNSFVNQLQLNVDYRPAARSLANLANRGAIDNARYASERAESIEANQQLGAGGRKMTRESGKSIAWREIGNGQTEAIMRDRGLTSQESRILAMQNLVNESGYEVPRTGKLDTKTVDALKKLGYSTGQIGEYIHGKSMTIGKPENKPDQPPASANQQSAKEAFALRKRLGQPVSSSQLSSALSAERKAQGLKYGERLSEGTVGSVFNALTGRSLRDMRSTVGGAKTQSALRMGAGLR